MSRNFENTPLDLLTRKGVFPYDFVEYESVLDTTTSLPEKKHFWSKLKEEMISDEDYNHAKVVWNTFECKTLRDYMNVYLRLDVCLLADIFEQFRSCIFNEYNLDLVYFLTLSSLAMECALKYSGQELEIISNPTIYNFIESGIRGDVSMICKRYAEAKQ